MRWPASIVAIVALAGCGNGGPETPAVPADAGPESPATPTTNEPARFSLEIVEGETAAVPVGYLVSQQSLPLYGQNATIGLEASYGTASADDILLMERTAVPLDGNVGEGTVELGLRALRDGTMEGTETLVLRPVKWGDHPDQTIRVRDAEIEVVIEDEPAPCSEVEVRVGESPRVLVHRVVGPSYNRVFASEIEIVAPASESVIEWIEWIEPADVRLEFSPEPPFYRRTRMLNAWRVESLGDRVRHRMTAQWWSGPNNFGPEPPRFVPPRFELQVCGGPGYGKFVRCSTTECAVHEEGF